MNSTSWLDSVFGSLELTSVIIGLPLNLITITYFYSQRHHLPSLLYLIIVLTDILILSSCLPSSLSMIASKQPIILSNKVACIVSGFSFNVASRMSVFLVALMAVARANVTLFPFKRSKVWIYWVLNILYLTLNISLATLPLVYSENSYYYHELFAACSWAIEDLSFVNATYSSSWYWWTYSTIVIPWLVPGIIVLIACVVAVCALIRSSRFSESLIMNRQRHMTKWRISSASGMDTCAAKGTRHATITILITTGVYIMFNVPCWLFYCYFLSHKNYDPVKWLQGRTGLFINIFLYRLSVVMNSAVNPIVYFCRMNALRIHNINKARNGLLALSGIKTKLQTVLLLRIDKSVADTSQISNNEIGIQIEPETLNMATRV